MIYNCKRIPPYENDNIAIGPVGDYLVELIIKDRVLNATVVKTYFDPHYNAEIWQINEPGPEPVLYEGLEFDMWLPPINHQLCLRCCF